MKKINNNAFTIFELAIVLSIIAFLIGVIISSNSLMRNAQVKSIISDMSFYKNAARTFEERYGNLPGDVVASNIWTGANNGNADGRVGNGNRNSSDMLNEPSYAWQHLSLANFVSFTPKNSQTLFSNLILPSSNIDGGFYILYDQNINNPMYNRVGTYLALSGMDSSYSWKSILSRSIASAVDIKIDDGLATNGILYTTRGDDANTACTGASCKCVDNHWTSSSWISFTSANYTYSDNSKSCIIILWLKELN